MNNNIILHKVNSKIVEQLAEETQLNNIAVPRGYVNLTAMCKAHNKRLDNYLRLKATQAFVEETCIVTSLSRNLLIIKILGRGDVISQGTWGHPNVAIHLAQWLSPKFAALASEAIVKVMTGQDTGNVRKQLNQEAYKLMDVNLAAYHDRLSEVEDLALPGDEFYNCEYSQWSI